MGILDRFLRKETPRIRFAELEGWCAEKEAELNKKADAELLALLKKIELKTAETQDLIKTLAKAQLFNAKITEREFQIMEGNRQTYIQKVKLFLDRTSATKPGNIREVEDFQISFNHEFEALAKGSVRSFYMVSEFFRNETSDVASGTREIEKIVIQIRQLRQKHIEDTAPFMRLAQLFGEFKKSGQRLKELRADENQSETERERLTGELKKLESELKTLLASAPFHEFQALTTGLDETNSEINSIEESLSTDFSVLEKALKKYAKLSTDENLIEPYVSDLLSSLRSDSELRIAGILERLRPALAEGKLGIKERVQEKMLAKIDSLTRDYLEETLARYRLLIGKKAVLESQAGSHQANQALILLDSKKQKLQSEEEALSKKMALIKEDISRIDPQRLKQVLIETAEKEFSLKIID